MPITPTAPCIPWETLRDAYVSRFGPLLRADAKLDFGDPPPPFDPDEPEESIQDRLSRPLPSPTAACAAVHAAKVSFYELSFASPTEADPRVVLATFGAAPRAGHEVFLVSAVPFEGFGGVLEELWDHHTPFSPGMVVPMKMWHTPFAAVLLAPPGAGSISLGDVGGTERFALRVIPLTRAEAELAADSVERLVSALRSAGVLDAVDPMRDCLFCPRTTQRYWALMRPPLIEITQRRLQMRSERLARLVAINAPECITEGDERLVFATKLLLKHIESKHVDPESPAERQAERFRIRVRLLKESLDGAKNLLDKGAVPGPLRLPCVQIATLALTTHPIAKQLLLAAEGDPDKERFDVEELLPELVNLIRQARSDADPAALLSGGRKGFAAAQEHGAGADGFIAPHVVWAYVMKGMFVTQQELSTKQGAATAKAIEVGIETANLALAREADGLPIKRLEMAGRSIILHMMKTWRLAHVVEGPMPEPSGQSPGSPALKQKAGKRQAPKKSPNPKKYH